MNEYESCEICGHEIVANPTDSETDCFCRRCSGCLNLLRPHEGKGFGKNGLCDDCYDEEALLDS